MCCKWAPSIHSWRGRDWEDEGSPYSCPCCTPSCPNICFTVCRSSNFSRWDCIQLGNVCSPNCDQPSHLQYPLLHQQPLGMYLSLLWPQGEKIKLDVPSKCILHIIILFCIVFGIKIATMYALRTTHCLLCITPLLPLVLDTYVSFNLEGGIID